MINEKYKLTIDQAEICNETTDAILCNNNEKFNRYSGIAKTINFEGGETIQSQLDIHREMNGNDNDEF